ncbi:MAG: uracil-DNA glycosylase [Frankiaceae bacterium]|nr:uracil-DNA glycosylase [Frankiaceae bacterium]
MSPRTTDPAAAVVAARAAGCLDLDALADRARGCVACEDLAAARTNVVVGDFPANARLLLVGEAPGAQEDLVGRPFVGKAGLLLDALLAEAQVDRASTAVANVLKCRPPGNRAPTRAEAARCSGWLDQQLALLDPWLVVTLGGTALAWALGHGVRLRDARGRIHDWRGRQLLVTYHPSAAIRFGPAGEPMAALRADLRRVGELLCAS